MFWGTPPILNQVIDNSALIFTSCCAEPQGQPESESLRPPEIFPEHVHSPTYMLGLADSQEYVRSFPKLLQALISIDILFTSFSRCPKRHLYLRQP